MPQSLFSLEMPSKHTNVDRYVVTCTRVYLSQHKNHINRTTLSTAACPLHWSAKQSAIATGLQFKLYAYKHIHICIYSHIYLYKRIQVYDRLFVQRSMKRDH